MAYEYFYPGSNYSLEPEYENIFSSYNINAGDLALTTDPRTADQLREISNKLNIGGKVIEFSGSSSTDIFESIPKEQLKEINRLNKLVGAELTVHGPIVDVSGYDKEGRWEETNRKATENQLWGFIERAKELDEKGNIPITFHSSVILPEAVTKFKEGEEEKIKSALIVDSRTGQIALVKHEEKFFPQEKIPDELKKEITEKYSLNEAQLKEVEEGKRFIPEVEIAKLNKEIWERNLNDLDYRLWYGKRYLDEAFEIEKGKNSEIIANIYGVKNREEELAKLEPEDKEIIEKFIKALDHANINLRDSYNRIRELYNDVYKNVLPEDKKKLDDYKEKIQNFINSKQVNNPEKIKEFAKLVDDGMRVLQNLNKPQLYVPLNNFLIDKKSETFANLAVKSYKKFRDKSPIISIENPPYGSALSTADELKQVIESTRKKFVEKAKQEGISESEAKKAADKIIGATWDVGHINMMRKYGYTNKELIQQTEKIAPMVKHVHLSDNFGFDHTELPIGMGNVPIKEIMEKLGKQGIESKKVIEAFNWWQHFKTPPLVQTMEAFSSPLYKMKAPYWNQIASIYGNYMQFPSAYLPEQHFSLYGGGFSSLPTELGGQIPGKRSRISGTPIE